MRADFLRLLKTMQQTKVEEVPSFVTLKALYNALVAKGLHPDIAATAASSVKVNVTRSFINDKELFDGAINAYSDVIVNLKIEFDKINPHFFVEAVRKQDMTLTYEA